jgi:RimJ/RimL family protein N-acetyltransferase
MIETERLSLRPNIIEDHAAYLNMCSDPEVMRYIGGQTLSSEDAWNRILRYAGHWSLLGYGMFAVIEKASGRFIGETGIADFHRGIGPDFDDVGEAAWVFSPEVHGRGYAWEAAEAAHRWFARQKGDIRTVCLIDPANGPSLALAARLGYSPFGEANYKGRMAVMLERVRT